MNKNIYLINLQLFANYNAAGANTTVSAAYQAANGGKPSAAAVGDSGLVQITNGYSATGNADLSPEMQTYYDMRLLDAAKPNLVHAQFGQKRPIPKNGGKTINFRKFRALPKALTPLNEGTPPPGQPLKVDEITATVLQYGDYIAQTDVLELTALDNTILEATKLLGNQAGETLDRIVSLYMHCTTNVTYADKVNASTGVKTKVTSVAGLDTTARLTVDTVKKVVAKLKSANAPKINGSYVAIIHPFASYDLMSDPAWEEMHKYTTPENMYEGEIGRVAGVRFVESSEALIDQVSYNEGASNAAVNKNVYRTLIFGDNAYGVTEVEGGGLQTIVKQKGSAGTADPLNQKSSVGWKAMLTAEILNPDYICDVYSRSAEFDT